MSNIIKNLENKKIIKKRNSIKNKALKTLLDFEMPENLVSVFNNTLYYSSNGDIQALIEIQNKDVKAIEIIEENDKYTVINDSKNQTIGINHECCSSKPFFTTHFCSLKNDISTKCYDYIDIISRNENIFDFNKKEKDNVKILVK